MTTTYFLNCVAGNVFGTKKSPALPTNYFIGLSTTTPNADGSGVSEPADSAYARVQLSSLSTPSSGEITNSAAIAFPDSTVAWGNISYFVIYDAKSGGNLLMYNPLDKIRTIQADSQVSFKAGGLKLSLKNP